MLSFNSLATAEAQGRSDRVPVFFLVEGPHDVQFLRRISRVLHAEDRQLPDLAQYEEQGVLVILPLGGNGPRYWGDRLTPLGKAEFHLYDRESPPQTEVRERAIELLNTRPRCHALLTDKRSLENYLHPQAVSETIGIEVQITDNSPVPEDVARCLFEVNQSCATWCTLSERARRRLQARAKSLLNSKAVERMTSERLGRQDPKGEVASWLATVKRLVDVG